MAIWQKTAIAKCAFGIACGAMGFLPEIAARIALETVSDFILSNLAIGSVVFVCADKETLQYYQEAFKRVVVW